ncbi:hypothetical protein [Rhodococcoides trifolii]|nr:hypothetical protein [Rhodococcus trifolii]
MRFIGYLWEAAAASVLAYYGGTALIATLRPPLEVWHVNNGELVVVA